MTKKQLLLKDLCARLHYGVKVKTSKGDGILCSIDYIPDGAYLGVSINGAVKDYYEFQYTKPYLRPLSSMTEEEKEKYCNLQDIFLCSSQYPVTDAYELFDWLNTHHFDYRGLIEKGLALEAPDGMYKTE